MSLSYAHLESVGILSYDNSKAWFVAAIAQAKINRFHGILNGSKSRPNGFAPTSPRMEPVSFVVHPEEGAGAADFARYHAAAYKEVERAAKNAAIRGAYDKSYYRWLKALEDYDAGEANFEVMLSRFGGPAVPGLLSGSNTPREVWVELTTMYSMFDTMSMESTSPRDDQIPAQSEERASRGIRSTSCDPDGVEAPHRSPVGTDGTAMSALIAQQEMTDQLASLAVVINSLQVQMVAMRAQQVRDGAVLARIDRKLDTISLWSTSRACNAVCPEYESYRYPANLKVADVQALPISYQALRAMTDNQINAALGALNLPLGAESLRRRRLADFIGASVP